MIDLAHDWFDNLPSSHVYHWSLTLESLEDLPSYLLSGSHCKLSEHCELIGINASH